RFHLCPRATRSEGSVLSLVHSAFDLLGRRAAVFPSTSLRCHRVHSSTAVSLQVRRQCTGSEPIFRGPARATRLQMQTSNRRKIRYAVVGAGNIAQVAVLPAFEHARDNSQLVALISGDPEKRWALRSKYALELEGDYAELEDVLERGKV